MNNKPLFKILQLDSIIKVLKLDERIQIHRYLSGRSDQLTTNILYWQEWIERNAWNPPEVRYGQDRLLYTINELGDWLPIEDYAKQLKLMI